jgi:hypothetical protein
LYAVFMLLILPTLGTSLPHAGGGLTAAGYTIGALAAFCSVGMLAVALYLLLTAVRASIREARAVQLPVRR